MSSLSLLLFKFVVVSICTCSSSEMCCFFFFFLFDETGDFIFSSMIGAGDFVVDSVASVVLTVFTVLVVVVVLTVFLFGEFWGELFRRLPPCIHPSSSFFVGVVLNFFYCWCYGFFCCCRCSGGGRRIHCCGGRSFLRAGSGKVSELFKRLT